MESFSRRAHARLVEARRFSLGAEAGGVAAAAFGAGSAAPRPHTDHSGTRPADGGSGAGGGRPDSPPRMCEDARGHRIARSPIRAFAEVGAGAGAVVSRARARASGREAGAPPDTTFSGASSPSRADAPAAGASVAAASSASASGLDAAAEALRRKRLDLSVRDGSLTRCTLVSMCAASCAARNGAAASATARLDRLGAAAWCASTRRSGHDYLCCAVGRQRRASQHAMAEMTSMESVLGGGGPECSTVTAAPAGGSDTWQPPRSPRARELR